MIDSLDLALGLPGFSAALENRTDQSPSSDLDGRALTAHSRPTLHCAVVRSFHSRPAPFRFGFGNARSVRCNFHLVDRHRAGKSGQHAGRLVRMILREVSHDLCEFESGRLTPCIFNVLLSRIRRSLAGSIRASVRHDVRVHVRFASAPTVSPCPRPVRDQTAACPCPRTVHEPVRIRVRGQSVAASSPRPVRDRELSMPVPGPSPRPQFVRDHDLSAKMSVSSPQPRPWSVYVRIQSETAITVCPCPNHELTVSGPQPHQSECSISPRLVRSCVQSANWP